jgi:hypothetical protein
LEIRGNLANLDLIFGLLAALAYFRLSNLVHRR